jgi:hypothetical protein
MEKRVTSYAAAAIVRKNPTMRTSLQRCAQKSTIRTTAEFNIVDLIYRRAGKHETSSSELSANAEEQKANWVGEFRNCREYHHRDRKIRQPKYSGPPRSPKLKKNLALLESKGALAEISQRVLACSRNGKLVARR